MKPALIVCLFLFCFLKSSFCYVHVHFCKTDLLDRYCALEHKEIVDECITAAGHLRYFEIFEACYVSVNAAEASLDEKKEKVCKLHSHEYEMLRRCFNNGLILELKRHDKIIGEVEECLLKQEKEEKKECHPREFVVTYRFGKWY